MLASSEGLEVQESPAISALHCAAYRGDVKRVRALLQGEGGFQVEKHLHKKVPSLRQRTPLLLACHGTSKEHGSPAFLSLPLPLPPSFLSAS